MNRLVKGIALGAGVLGLAVGYLVLRPPHRAALREIRVASSPEILERGKFLYEVVADCDGCHGERNWGRQLAPVVRSGAGFVFPAEMGLPGQVVASNITSDPVAGIGAWSDGEKLRAIREGIGRDGRALFPMMPYDERPRRRGAGGLSEHAAAGAGPAPADGDRLSGFGADEERAGAGGEPGCRVG